MLDQTKTEQELLIFDIKNLQYSKVDQSDFEALRDTTDTRFTRLTSLLDLKDNQIQTIENFVEKYVPIRVQSQISEILGEVLTGKQRELLSEIEKRKFDELHQVLLIDNGFSNLLLQMKNINTDLGYIEEEPEDEEDEEEVDLSLED